MGKHFVIPDFPLFSIRFRGDADTFCHIVGIGICAVCQSAETTGFRLVRVELVFVVFCPQNIYQFCIGFSGTDMDSDAFLSARYTPIFQKNVVNVFLGDFPENGFWIFFLGFYGILFGENNESFQLLAGYTVNQHHPGSGLRNGCGVFLEVRYGQETDRYWTLSTNDLPLYSFQPQQLGNCLGIFFKSEVPIVQFDQSIIIRVFFLDLPVGFPEGTDRCNGLCYILWGCFLRNRGKGFLLAQRICIAAPIFLNSGDGHGMMQPQLFQVFF